MLIMALLVLSIGFMQNLQDLLEDVMNPLNESGGFVGLKLNMGRFFVCGCKRCSYGEKCCSWVEHREDSHPMYMNA